MRRDSSRFMVHGSWLRVMSFLLFALWISAALTGCAKREIKNRESSGRNIVCFGDSITFGYGVSSGEDFPSILGKLVKIEVINAGIDGDTSVEALKRLDADVLNREPFLVLVEFGGNDFLRKIPQEETINNIKQMVEKIQEKGAMVALVDISAGMFMREYRAAFRNIAKKEGTIFIPSILNGIITNPSMKSDFLHPNAQGYKLIAQRIYDSIKPYLKKEALLEAAKN